MDFGTYMIAFAIAAVGVTLIGCLLIMLGTRKTGKGICIAAAALSTAACLGVAVLFSAGGMQDVTYDLVSIGDTVIFGITFDRMSVLLAPTFVGIGLLVCIYATAYLTENNREHPDKPRKRFFAFMAVFIGAMAGLVYSSTIVGQLVFFEMTGACSWGLIGYYGNEISHKSAMKALIITHIASLGLYTAAAALFIQTGTFSLSAIAQLGDGWKTFVLLAILFAAWGKSAQLPFYMWLPSAMVAPTPVSAYLHGASMVKVGVCIFARALICAGAVPHVVGWVGAIGAIATLLFSFFMYLPQTDMKRLLAFSTISQLSYMFLAFSLSIFGSDLAFTGGIAHIFNHAFAKTLFFLLAGGITYTMGTRLLTKLHGLMNKSPLMGAAFAFAALSIAGVPPFSGFFSKFAIFSGGFQAASGSWLLTAFVIIALAESICCFAWFLKWMSSVLPGEPSETVADAIPLPKTMAVVFVILMVMTLCSGPVASAWLG